MAVERLRSFLNAIVLTNCIEYFRLEEQSSHAPAPQRMRLFFNAVIAVDSALSYALEAEQHALGLESFLDFLAGTEPALRDVQRIAQSLTRKGDAPLALTASEPSTATVRSLRNAFAFWLDYARSLEEEMSESTQRMSFGNPSMKLVRTGDDESF